MHEGLGSISSPPIGHFECPGLTLRRSSRFYDRMLLYLSFQVSGLHSDNLVCRLGSLGMPIPDEDFLAWLVLAILVSLPLLLSCRICPAGISRIDFLSEMNAHLCVREAPLWIPLAHRFVWGMIQRVHQSQP
jgi:hypothetical protein